MLLRGALLLASIVACRPAESPNRGARRVITVTPSLTEIVFALGRGDRVVGVSDYCDHPPAARRKTRIGGLVNPNLERILALEPDLVVLDSDPTGFVERLRSAGVRTLRLRAESLQDIDAAIEALGGVMDAEAAAERLRLEIRRDLQAIERRVEGRPRKRVLFVVDRRIGRIQDVFAVGKRSFLTRVSEVAGGVNVLADVDRGAVGLSTEALIASAPDVLFDTTRDPAGLSPWGALPSIPAVRTGRLVDASDPVFSIPGPRVARAADRIARSLHPEAFDR